MGDEITPPDWGAVGSFGFGGVFVVLDRALGGACFGFCGPLLVMGSGFGLGWVWLVTVVRLCSLLFG